MRSDNFPIEQTRAQYLREGHWLTSLSCGCPIIGVAEVVVAQAGHDTGTGCLGDVSGLTSVRQGEGISDGAEQNGRRETLPDDRRLRRRFLPRVPGSIILYFTKKALFMILLGTYGVDFFNIWPTYKDG